MTTICHYVPTLGTHLHRPLKIVRHLVDLDQRQCFKVCQSACVVERQCRSRETPKGRIMVAVARKLPFSGPAILTYGFRPFFLAAAAYAAIIMMIWLPVFDDSLELVSIFAPADWHAHEMIFGFLAAVIAGFLLTAIPNWTGRLPVQGYPLLLLFSIWLAGRIAITFSEVLGWQLVLLIDCTFLLALVFVAAREIVAGKNWRNLKVVLPLSVLFVANVWFHIEAHLHDSTGSSRRLGLAVGIVFIMLIGGRIIPSFTRNWLVKRDSPSLPTAFNRFDGVVIGVSALALLSWVGDVQGAWSGLVLIGAGLLNLVRLARWAGIRTAAEPLIFMLHIAYVFVPAGFILLGLAMLFPDLVPVSVGAHAFGVGAVGCMTLTVMTRATLGHTGQPLAANLTVILVFAAIIMAAAMRVGAVFDHAFGAQMLHLAGVFWILAFAGFVLANGKALVSTRMQ